MLTLHADLRDEAMHQATTLAEALQNVPANELSTANAASLRQLALDLVEFRYACEDMSDQHVPLLRWSPVRAYPGFSVMPLNPGRLIGRLWQTRKDTPAFLQHIIMTSATLDAPDAHLRFQGFRNETGLLGDNYVPALSGRFAPRRFGRMRFVLPDPAVNPPAARTGQDDYDPDQPFRSGIARVRR